MAAEALAAEVVKVLVQNLIDYSMKEISLIRGLGKEAKKLSVNLDTIQKFLNDAETRTIEGDAVKSWLENIENAAFDADNVLDELNYHLLSNRISSTKPIKEKVLSCFCSSFNHYIANPRKMASRIKEINDNLDSINAEAKDLGLQNVLAAAPVPSLLDAAQETNSFSVDPIFIGRDGDASEVVATLAGVTSGGDHRASIVSIVGMGGLGKTTLTRTVFNRVKGGELSQFGLHIWVYVSQIFEPDTIFKKILEQLNLERVETSSTGEVILSKLQQSLKDKTYLLVLDDVWNRDPLKWEDFINSLLGVTSTDGNAIVVTTRSTEVASTVNPLRTHELKGLSDEDCWSIIKAKAFGKEEGIPLVFETIGRKIATRCQGLPLAANVVGGVLRSDKSEEKWLEIEEKWLPRDKGDSINKILKLSYNTLSPPSIKKCFAYCSVFPKGHKILKQELIECWMAEGFLQSDGRGDDDANMESVGEIFVSILLHNSLLQVAERNGYGDVECCTMHDLVHDLAHSLDGADHIRRTRYMSSSDDIPEEVAKHLRTLFIQRKLPDTFFSGFKCLHVLTLSTHSGADSLPSSIRKLLHLRSLDVSDIAIDILPEWIGELHHLQTLRAWNGYTRKLPSTLKYLTKLRHLYIHDRVELPAEIGRLIHLQTLCHFTVRDQNGCRIKELENLNNLKGELYISHLERVGDREEAEKANLSKKLKLSVLSLRWERNGEDGERNDQDEDVLEGLRPNPDIKGLEISGFNGRRFPSWTLKMAVENAGLNKLVHIMLDKCCECEEIPMLGHLPNLKYLYISGMRNVKRINSSFYGLASVAFPSLEQFELLEMPNLVEFESHDQVHSAVLPSLEYLRIRGCERLMSVPTHFSSSSCLKKLRILKSGLESLPDCMFINNPDLSKLEISECHNLRQVPRGLECLSSLERLVIHECPKLERLVAAEDDRPSVGGEGRLNLVQVSDCQALVWMPCELVVGSSLESLSLKNLGSLQNLPSLIDRLPKSPRLKELAIACVPNFVSSCWSHASFNSMTKIEIDVSIGGSMEAVDGILQGCSSSLKSLKLKGVETWECLPSSLQHLTPIRELTLENFGMEELPDWLGNLLSLKSLYLYRCKELRRLPSAAAMRLTTLKGLFVRRCPQLHIQLQQQNRDDGQGEGDFEWAKISMVDGSFLKTEPNRTAG